jgi:hypothetical protein
VCRQKEKKRTEINQNTRERFLPKKKIMGHISSLLSAEAMADRRIKQKFTLVKFLSHWLK